MVWIGKTVGATCLFVMGVALAFGGCGGESQLVSSETPLPSGDTLQPPAAPPAPPDTTTPPPPPPVSPPDTVTPPAPDPSDPPPFRGIPFGFFQMDYLLLGEDWNSLKRVSIPDSVRYYLDIARSRGARVFVQLVASHEQYQNPDGSFSLAKYKEQLDKYKEVDLNGYIEDGTLIGHLLVDEPNDPSNWGGRPMTYEMIEAAAQHSKSLWPRLPTLIRSRPTWLARAPFSWQFLDGGWGQYVARYGDLEHFRDIEVEAANRAGLMVVWGLNVINGGDGSSRKTGTRSDRFNMTASEVLRYGRVLLPLESSCGFLLWRYESAYVENEDLLSALKTLSKEAKDLPFRSCLR